MLEIEVFQMISIILLMVAIISVYLANSEGGDSTRSSYDPVEIVKLSKVVDFLWMLSTLIIPLVVVILLAAAPVFIYGGLGTITFYGDYIVQMLGLLFAAFGFILLIWSGRTLGMYDVGDIALDRDHVLIETGLYSKIRHPSYTSNILINIAIMFFLLNLIFSINLFIVLVLSVYRARLEEQLLSSEKGFGNQYIEYMKRTGKFLPPR